MTALSNFCGNGRRPAYRPAWRFFRAYFLRRGFLDGFPGLWIAWSTAYQTFVRHSRLYEHERRNRQPENSPP